jgi:glutamate-1-semialdehyde 2,1-aminomutase
LFYPNKNLKPQTLSDGLSLDDKKKLIYIPYNDIEKSNKILNKFKNDINCIIIEPIQACLPLDNVKKYLHFLERFCKKNNSTLIFDEIITGIRIRPGSIQRKYNINADITTIGKILGGGLPIGVIGISEKINKIIKKKKIKIFFGGTFSGNSLSSFVGNETLKFLLKNKVLFSNLNKKSLYFQKNLNQFITKEGIEAKVYRFDSILRIVFSSKTIKNKTQREFLEKKKNFNIIRFRQYLLDHNIYYPSNGIIFLSNSTSYKNIDYVLNHIKIALNLFIS